MRRVVRGVMGPYAAEVDDALQQSLVGLVHALPAFRSECAPAGYACRIAFRTALALRKSAHTARSLRDSSAEMECVPDSKNPNAISESKRRTELVRNLLEEIHAEQAETLALRTMLGWSIEEIAQATSVPINTVRSRLRLAKEALRKKIMSDPSLAEELGVSA
jgi:RNA polymerase sigma-70 factor (ECF subfamily)